MGQQISLLQAVVLAMAFALTSAACAIPPDSNGHVDIPSRTNLATSAFHGCIDLRSISFPETGSFFPENGYRQSGLTQITIPDTVTNLPSNVFWDADSLTEAVIGNAVTWVGHHAFRSSALKQIVIPDSVTIVNEYAFYETSSLTRATIGDSVNTIGSGAFARTSVTCFCPPDLDLERITIIGENPSTVCDAASCFDSPSAPPPLLPPSPPSPPPPSTVAGPIASLTGDPHAIGGHGDRSDLRGEDRAIYIVLSGRNVSFAVQMEHRSFRATTSKLTVNGSWARAAYWVLRTATTDQLINVSFQAKYPRKAIVAVLGGDRTELLQDASPLVIDNLHLHLQRRQLYIQTGRWLMSAQSTIYYPHPHSLRLNIKIQPTYQDWLDEVAPHGVLGQTYDRDNVAVDGDRDSYARLDSGYATSARTHAGGVITTRSNAQGGIEGQLPDYRVSGPFETHFRYSRFDSIAAAPRNISRLVGRKRPIRTRAY